MDSPHVPGSSSPIVMIPNSTQFSLPINMTAMATTSARNNHPCTRSSASSICNTPFGVGHPSISHNQQSYQPTTVRTVPISSIGTVVGMNLPSISNQRGSGPTTRSRRRKNRNPNTNNSNTNTIITPLPPPSFLNRRHSPSHSTSVKRSRAKKARVAEARKKPPPGLKKAPPPAVAAGLKIVDDNNTGKMPAAAAVIDNCCICMCDVEPNDLALINGCDHRFCFGCIEKWAERENKCPLCKVRFTKIDRVNKKRKKGTKNTKKVKDRDQRSDIIPGEALQGLLANLNRNGGSLARIIFGGSFDFGGASNPNGVTSRAAFASRSGPRLGFDFDDSDEEDSPLATFMRSIHGSSGASGVSMSTTVVRPMSVTARFTTSTRSYARNVHDATAGNGAENPLEIDDDSVEEVIEID